MLQWMGGGRRKVKTTRKSMEARQHQFFEQRRQQLRSQAADLSFNKSSSLPHASIYSLDIASLKSLSQLARQPACYQIEDAVNHCSEECKKDKGYGKEPKDAKRSGVQYPGYQALEAANPLRSSIGTQWTPASAAAAASLLKNEPGLLPQATPHKVNQNGTEDVKQEQRNLGVQSNTKEHKRAKQPAGIKNPRPQAFEKFQILDFINRCDDNEERKKDPGSELYAAYAVEGIGQIPNHTPKVPYHTPKNHDTCNVTPRNADDAGPACQAPQLKHEVFWSQQLPGGFWLSRQERKNEECDTEANLKGFYDAAEEKCMEPNNARQPEGYSPEAQSEAELGIWGSPLNANCFGSMRREEGEFLARDDNTRLPFSEFIDSPQYPKLPTSPKSVVSLDEDSLFSFCPTYQSTAISCKVDGLDLFNCLDDDELCDVNASLNTDLIRNLSSGTSDDAILTFDAPCSPGDSTSLLFGKRSHGRSRNMQATCHDAAFGSPVEELYSGSSFEFRVAMSKSSAFKEEFQSPCLWDKKKHSWERELDAAFGSAEDPNFCDITLSALENSIEAGFSRPFDADLQCFKMPQHEERETNSAGHLKEDDLFLSEELMGRETSSIDMLFGNSISEFPSSPTSPLMHPCGKVQKASHMANKGIDSHDADDSSFQKVSGSGQARPAIAIFDHVTTWIVAQDPMTERVAQRRRGLISNFLEELKYDTLSDSECTSKETASSFIRGDIKRESCHLGLVAKNLDKVPPARRSSGQGTSPQAAIRPMLCDLGVGASKSYYLKHQTLDMVDRKKADVYSSSSRSVHNSKRSSNHLETVCDDTQHESIRTAKRPQVHRQEVDTMSESKSEHRRMTSRKSGTGMEARQKPQLVQETGAAISNILSRLKRPFGNTSNHIELVNQAA